MLIWVLAYYANTPMQYIANFNGSACKNGNFQMRNCDIFLIFAQNIDLGYTLEAPHPRSRFSSKNKKKMYTHENPSFILYKGWVSVCK